MDNYEISQAMASDRIDAVARSMCAALGLDPEKEVRVQAEEVMTPAEIAALSQAVLAWRKGPIDAPNPRPDDAWHPLWMTYRGKAAEAIAARVAILQLGGK